MHSQSYLPFSLFVCLVGIAAATPALAQECIGQPAGWPCGDPTSDACTNPDTCNGLGSCMPNHNFNGTPCDDGDVCSIWDTCWDGTCFGGVPPDCDDGNVCTDDSCSPGSGCVSTNNAAPCDDGDACSTGDTCSGGACVGGTPPDCDDGNVCTDDSCDTISGCVSTHNTAPCDDGDVCTTSDECSAGYCVGNRTPGCCNTDADCEDYNECTDESCNTNACTRTNVASDTPCGSAADNACTGPDTCDGTGACLPNDLADGTTCSGVEPCTAGLCSPTRYRAVLLDEGGYEASEPLGQTEFGDFSYIAGRVSSLGVDLAVVWTCDAQQSCTLTELPTGGATTSVANGASCDGSGTCLIVGAKGDPCQPVAWVNAAGNGWVEETMPLPINATTATPLGAFFPVGDYFSAVGSSTDAQGFSKATYWDRDALGVWSVVLLPDSGIPDRDSMATSISACPDTAPASLCDPGSRVAVGWAQDGLGRTHPAVWREAGEGSGSFEMSALPLPAGVVGHAYFEPAVSTNDEYFSSLSWPEGPPISASVSGTVVLTDGSTRGVVWTTDDLQNWDSAVLSPLPGFGSSTGTLTKATARGGTPPYSICYGFAGSSFPAGGNPLAGVATLWTSDYEPAPDGTGWDYFTDMNDLVDGLPTGAILRAGISCSSGLTVQPRFTFSAVYTLAGGGAHARSAPPFPHAAALVPIPQADIPAVSQWGLVAMTLLVLTAGTVVCARRRPIQA